MYGKFGTIAFNNLEDVLLDNNLIKDYDKAVKVYDEILLVDKSDYNVLFNKAIALHALNNFDSAIAIYKSLYEQRTEPKVKEYLIKAYMSQGQALSANGQPKKAIGYFESASLLNTNDSSYFIS